MSEARSRDLDAITAHLDRGWELVEQQKLAEARISAHHILKLNQESPEAYTLLGAIAATEGDPEEALDLLEQAIDLEPEYLDAILYAAEIAANSLGRWRYALQLCDQAEPLLTSNEDRLELGLLRAEALLGAGEADQAEVARVMEKLPPPPFPEPTHYLRSGRILLELGRQEPALELLREVLADENRVNRIDAHYLVAIALEKGGRTLEAVQHFFEVHRLESQLPPPSWTLSEEEFEALVIDSLERLPGELHEQVQDLPVVVLPQPPLELVAEGLDPRGLVYIGACHPRYEGEDHSLPSAIFVYKACLERHALSREEVVPCIEQALEQEIAHLSSSARLSTDAARREE
jgi:tetratricopeptide (TPR) repeat protein